MQPSTDPLPRDRIPDAQRVLASALLDDPGFTHVVGDARARRLGLEGILGVALADVVATGAVRTVTDGEELLGVAVWQPPGRYPMSTLRGLRAIPRMLALGLQIRGDLRALARLGAAVDERFPTDGVWYLQALGVSPSAQGRGVGGVLLRWGIERAEEDGVDAYLETGKPANVAYYERFGFELVDHVDQLYEGGPSMWFMRRPSR